MGVSCLVVGWVVWSAFSEDLGDALRGSSTDPEELQATTLSRYEAGLEAAGADRSFTEPEVTASVGEYWGGDVAADAVTIVVHIPGSSTSAQCFELRARVVPDGVEVTSSPVDDGCIADLQKH